MVKKKTLDVDENSLDYLVSKRKEELDGLFETFLYKFKKTKIDKLGNLEDATNPYLVSTYFFKTINPVSEVEPKYTSEQLSLVWQLYKDIVERINMEITLFQPTLSHFASFTGLTLESLQTLRNSRVDESMHNLVEKIFTEVFDANMTLTQHKKLTERSTTYRMKVENEAIEKKNPTVNINVGAKAIDLSAMNERIAQIQEMTRKQIEYEGK